MEEPLFSWMLAARSVTSPASPVRAALAASAWSATGRVMMAAPLLQLDGAALTCSPMFSGPQPILLS